MSNILNEYIKILDMICAVEVYKNSAPVIRGDYDRNHFLELMSAVTKCAPHLLKKGKLAKLSNRFDVSDMVETKALTPAKIALLSSWNVSSARLRDVSKSISEEHSSYLRNTLQKLINIQMDYTLNSDEHKDNVHEVMSGFMRKCNIDLMFLERVNSQGKSRINRVVSQNIDDTAYIPLAHSFSFKLFKFDGSCITLNVTAYKVDIYLPTSKD